MTDTPAPVSRRGWIALIVVIAMAALGWRGWHAWQLRQARQQQLADATAQQWQALDARIDALRRDQRAQAQRLQQADATNRVLRDEVLGIGQRAALLEDSVRRLADPQRHGVQGLRLDEVELLLGQGEARLRVAGDLEGARRAYALAAGVLAGVDDPAYLNLRQALEQERAALDALGADPRAVAEGRLQALVATLQPPARETDAAHRSLPWWRRAFAGIVQAQPSSGALAREGADRSAAWAALQLELTLARAAAERRDERGYRDALLRSEALLRRLWPPSVELRGRLQRLHALQALPLSLRLPVLGSTRQQLQAMRAAR